MVKATSGTLIECDSTVKQLILNLDEKNKFVISDLDETHLLIQSSWVDFLKVELDRLLDQNSYTIDDKDVQNKQRAGNPF